MSGYDGLTVGPSRGDGVRIRLEGKPTYEYDYTMLCGGWMRLDTPGTTRPDIEEVTIDTDKMAAAPNLTSIRYVRPLDFPYSITDSPAGDLYEMTKISVKYYLDGVGDDITIYLESYPKTGGSVTIIKTWNISGTIGALDTYTDSSVATVLDFDSNTYRLRINMNNFSIVGVGPILFQISRALVE